MLLVEVEQLVKIADVEAMEDGVVHFKVLVGFK